MQRAPSITSSAPNSILMEILLFAALLIVLVLIAHRWRVYYHVTVIEVGVGQVLADGSRVPTATPERFSELPRSVPEVEQKIRRFMRKHADELTRQDATGVEWTIDFGVNSTKLDQQVVLRFDADGRERR